MDRHIHLSGIAYTPLLRIRQCRVMNSAAGQIARTATGSKTQMQAHSL